MSANVLGGLLLVAVVALLVAVQLAYTWRARALAGVRIGAELKADLIAARSSIAELRASRSLAPASSTPGALALRQLEALNAPKKGNGDQRTNGELAPWLPKTPAMDPARAEAYAKVSNAIAARTGGDWRLGRHLRGVADELLAAGMDHAEVARRILEGDPVDA